MRVDSSLANRAFAIIASNIPNVDTSEGALRMFRDVATIKKKCDLKHVNAPGYTWWNLSFDKPPFVEYSGKEDGATVRVAAVNNALRELFTAA